MGAVSLLALGSAVSPSFAQDGETFPDDTIFTLYWQDGSEGQTNPPPQRHGELHTLDPDTAASTFVTEPDAGTGFGLGPITGLEWDASTRRLLAVNYHGDETRMYSIDPATGEAPFVTLPARRVNFTGLDVDPATGVIYGVHDDIDVSQPRPSKLVTIDRETGSVADVASVTLDGAALRLASIAIQPGTGTLFGGDYEGRLLAVDRATGEATVVAEDFLGEHERQYGGLDFGCAGTLFANDHQWLYTVDADAGTSTVVGRFVDGSDASENITVVCGGPTQTPEVPENQNPVLEEPSPQSAPEPPVPPAASELPAVPAAAPPAAAVAGRPTFTG